MPKFTNEHHCPHEALPSMGKKEIAVNRRCKEQWLCTKQDKKKVAKCFKYGWWVENGGHRVFATLGNQDYGSDQTMIGGQQIVQGTS